MRCQEIYCYKEAESEVVYRDYRGYFTTTNFNNWVKTALLCSGHVKDYEENIQIKVESKKTLDRTLT